MINVIIRPALAGFNMKNDVCEIVLDINNYFKIIVDNKEVGFINLSSSNEVTFFIQEKYRGNHFCSNGLYLFNKMIHKKINVLKTVIPIDNDLARHIVEHSGYYIVSKDDKNIYYEHKEITTTKDELEILKDNEEVLYFAGGCFWGMERVFKILNGVVSTSVGYANGTYPNPSYSDVIRNNTGHKETVKVIFDKDIISLETLLKAFFMCINPEQEDGQGNDVGEQYKTGIFYKNKDLKESLDKYFEEEKKKHYNFYVELKSLDCFYEAEEYHQNYLEKNPDGYCHITLLDLERVKELNKE